MGLFYFVFVPPLLWMHMTFPQQQERSSDRPQLTADIIEITDRHRQRRRQKILRKQRRGY